MPWDDAVYQWLIRGFLVTLPLLVASTVVVACSQEPVRRVRLIELTLIASLAAPWLALLPGLPRWSPAAILGAATAVPLDAPSVTRAERRETGRAAGRNSGAPAERSLTASLSATTGRQAAAVGDASSPAAPSTSGRTVGVSRWRPPSRIAFDVRRWVAIVYLAGVATLSGWWTLGIVGLMRVLRSAKPADDRCRGILAELAGRTASRVKLLVSNQIEQPFTFTWRQAVIVMPRSLCEQDDPRPLRWALAHEWAHVRNHDALSWSLAGLARVVFFYQPLVWWLRSRLRLAQDYLADAQGAGQAPSPEDYAEFLTTWVAAHRRPAAIGLGIGGRTSELYRRVVMLVEHRRPLEHRCPLIWRLTAATGVLLIVTAAGTYGEAPGRAAPRRQSPPKSESSPKSPDRSDTKRSPPANAETRRLIEAVLARATAIRSGVLMFTETFDVPYGAVGPSPKPAEPLWRCSFSGESWAIRIRPGVQVVNHNGRFMTLGSGPAAFGNMPRLRLTIESSGTWTSKHYEFPIYAGTIEHESTRKFMRENVDRARLAGGAKIDSVEARIIEWTVGPTELHAFGWVNDMLKGGGTLRLYVAEQLSAVLPRIEYVDRFGTVQMSFNVSDFREVAPGIYFPFHYEDGGKRIEFDKVEFVNEKLPEAEFVIAPIPAATHVSDERPKSTDNVDPAGNRTVDLGRYPYRQFTTGAEYPDGLPAALLAEMDRDVISPENSRTGEPESSSEVATKGSEAPQAEAGGAEPRETDPPLVPKEELRYGGKDFFEWKRQLLTDLEPKVQVEAIQALQAFAAKGYADEAATAIGWALKGGSSEVHSAAFAALTQIGRVAVPVLLEALRSDDPTMRAWAASTLGDIGPAAEAAIEPLENATRDTQRGGKSQAGRALAKIGAGEARLRPIFERLFRSDDTDLRHSVVSGILEAKDLSPEVVPLLLEALDDDDWGLRVVAGKALVRKGPARRDVMDGLTRLVRDDIKRGEFVIVHELLKEGKNAETVAPAVVAAAPVVLADPALAQTTLVEEVPAALQRLGPKAASAVPALVQFIVKDSAASDDSLIMAMDALRAIGPAAREAVPVLKAWVADPPANSNRDWERIRKHALKVLQRLKEDGE